MPLRMLRAPRPWLTPSRPHGGPSRISRTRTPSNGPHSDPRRWALPSVSQHCLAMHGEPKWLRSTTRASHHIAMGAGIKTMQQRNPPRIRDGGGWMQPQAVTATTPAEHRGMPFRPGPVSHKPGLFPAVGDHFLLQRAESGNGFGSRETMRC